MLKLSSLNIKKISSSLLCLGITLFLLLVLWISGFFSYFDTTLYDFFLTLKIERNHKKLNAQIIPIDLNDRSEMTLGERLDDRSAFGDLFSVLAHSNAQAALDFIYRGEREKDEVMLDAASRLKSIIVAVIPVPEGRENVSYRELEQKEAALLRRNLWRPKEYGSGNAPRAGTFVMPFQELGETATQLAHLSVDPDNDGIYRRTPLFYSWEDGLIPAISLATALQELGINGNDIEIFWGKEVLIPLGPNEKISIPIDSAGVIMIPFGGYWEDTTHRFSFDIIADALNDENALNDVRSDLLRSLCFVADTTFAKKDIGPVPFDKVYLLSGIHTWVISAILDASVGEDTFFRTAPRIYRYLCMVLIVVLLFLLGLIKDDKNFSIAFAALFLIFTGMSLSLWFFFRIMPWYSFGSLAILFAWLCGFIQRFSAQRRRQLALERYVSRGVAQKVLAGKRSGLVPVYKELTIVFTDIAGFTRWSADRDAQVVHGFLNVYLESMADILLEHGATVDKFMGDGILAFFGDPMDDPRHTVQAVSSAIVMQKKILELREEWFPKVGIDLKVRIGINTGKVIVGDLGTRKRIEYTVIGSAVNLAQRMESLAPTGGILITENTKVYLEGLSEFNYSKEQELIVKGYDKPIIAYQIIF